jgi:hypothetical protein
LEERVRVLSKDIKTDSVEFDRISKEIAANRMGFLNDAQRFALSQRSSYVQYIKKQMPVNMASLKQELVRARRYSCSTEEQLKLIEAEAAKAADLVTSASPGR